jgi:uncharacterized protein (DUF427 family)
MSVLVSVFRCLNPINPCACRRDALLYVNLLYSDSYVKSFCSAWGRGSYFNINMCRNVFHENTIFLYRAGEVVASMDSING